MRFVDLEVFRCTIGLQEKGRNPKTGEQVQLSPKHVPHFKPGKEMRERVNENKEKYSIQD